VVQGRDGVCAHRK